jgi:hypothetical protein
MYGILNLVGHRLMQRKGAGVALDWPWLFLLSSHELLPLLCKHFIAMSLLEQLTIALAHLLFVVFAFSSVALLLAIAVWRRVLRQAVADGWHVLPWRLRWATVVLMLWRLGQVGYGEALATRGLRVMLMVGCWWRW